MDDDGLGSFILAGEHGMEARSLLESGAKLVWTCEAVSHFDAMTKYYKHMDWGEYTTDFPEHDKRAYADLGWE